MEIENLIPRMSLLSGEEPMDFEGLREAFTRDLNPGTPYETALVENLVSLEWEGIRHRRMRDQLILAKCRDLAVGAFQDGRIGILPPSKRDDAAKARANALVGEDTADRQKAEQALAKINISTAEIVAIAYQICAETLAIHEAKLADIEKRRRRLRQDFDALKTARHRKLEDAEIVDA